MPTLNKLAISAVGASLFTLGSVVTFSESASALNERPVEVGETIDGEGQSLQELLDSITLSGPGIDVENDQTPDGLFTNQFSGASESTFLFEVAGFAPNNVFGIYQAGNPDYKVPLFFGDNDPGDAASVFFLADNSVGVSTIGFPPGNTPPPNLDMYSDFGNIFGFYISTGGGEMFFSEDRLNPGGVPQALIFKGDGETVLQAPGRQSGTFSLNEFIVAFEDQLYGSDLSDEDFQDLVVVVESIEPESVPEPAAVAGLGLMAGIFAVSRRRKNYRDS